MDRMGCTNEMEQQAGLRNKKVCCKYAVVCLRCSVNLHQINPLTLELSPSVQRLLTIFFLLVILLLEPCISLTYALKTKKYTNYSFSLLIMYGSSYML
jgi:hypothetical protein